MTTDTKIPKATLKKAAGILQRAHDYIELNGFDIDEYSSEDYDTFPDYSLGREKNKLSELGKQVRQCCYIGSVRLAAGVKPHPSRAWCEDGTAAGDGPELGIALKELDRVAEKRAKRNKWTLDTEGRTAPGRLVEALGFQLKNQGKTEAQQKAYALGLLRKALTEIYRDK